MGRGEPGGVRRLVPGLVGLHYLDLPGSALHVLSASGAGGRPGLGRSRSPHRPLILNGLALIVGGYVLTFAARLDWGPGLVLVQRYQLVPQLGLSLLLAIAARPWLARCEARPGLVPAALVVLTGLLFVFHAPEMIAQARLYRFPNQVRTLAVLDRLATVCRAKGVTREQAILTLNAFRPKWAYGDPRTLGVNPLLMLPETAVRSRVPDADVRATVLAALTSLARAALPPA